MQGPVEATGPVKGAAGRFESRTRLYSQRSPLRIQLARLARISWTQICARFFENFEMDASFFAYSWKLPAYSGAFLLTIDNFCFVAYSWR